MDQLLSFATNANSLAPAKNKENLLAGIFYKRACHIKSIDQMKRREYRKEE